MQKKLALQVKRLIDILYSMDSNIYEVSYKMRLELYHKIFSGIVLICTLFIAISLILKFLVFPVRCESDSMMPDIPSESLEFVSPLFTVPKRGDVVLLKLYESKTQSLPKRMANAFFHFVTGRQWIPFEEKMIDGTKPLLRRVVGVPGDTVYIDRYVVYVKPEGQKHFLTEFEVRENKYNIDIVSPSPDWDVELGAKASVRQITLKEGEYYVLGDDRLSSLDSRVWGPVRQSSIIGKALLVYFPFSKFRIL